VWKPKGWSLQRWDCQVRIRSAVRIFMVKSITGCHRCPSMGGATRFVHAPDKHLGGWFLATHFVVSCSSCQRGGPHCRGPRGGRGCHDGTQRPAGLWNPVMWLGGGLAAGARPGDGGAWRLMLGFLLFCAPLLSCHRHVPPPPPPTFPCPTPSIPPSHPTSTNSSGWEMRCTVAFTWRSCWQWDLSSCPRR
jgi:hypothetical protein